MKNYITKSYLPQSKTCCTPSKNTSSELYTLPNLKLKFYFEYGGKCMNAKKCIALLLFGTILASLLSGCRQTTIDHHFFTDSEIDTEYVTEIIMSESAQKIQDLEDFLNSKDIQLNAQISPSLIDVWVPTGPQPEGPFLLGDPNIKTMTTEELKTNISEANKPPISSQIAVLSSEAITEDEMQEMTMSQFINEILRQIDIYVSAFQGLDETSLDKLRDACGDDPLALMACIGYDGTSYYISSALACSTTSISWKGL